MEMRDRQRTLDQFVVTAEQMRQIEQRVFAAGMPVAALMEKVAGLIVRRIEQIYPWRENRQVGVLVGPGHNGGDALVVARELDLKGYAVSLYRPFSRLKELTGHQAEYCASLGIPLVELVEALQDCELLIDGLFGFGLQRSLTGELATAVDQINQWHKPVVSIDLPSGLHTDTGEILGTAIKATHTLCLGLWKQGLLQDQALDYLGEVELVDFGLPLADIQAVLGTAPAVQRIATARAIAQLPLQRALTAHKYTNGHLLLICGSRRYAGAAILTGLGARASGVGMLSIAVPQSLKSVLTAQLPEALIIECPETASGAILCLPEEVDLGRYSAIACGPGLSLDANPVVRSALASPLPVVLDADGLNILAEWGAVAMLEPRQATTVLTPHLGEFKRLFPHLVDHLACRVTAVRQAAADTGAIVLLKGARVAIADPQTVWLNTASTPALARGGSGDVLTGLLGGLIAQKATTSHAQTRQLAQTEFSACIQSAVWWHSQAAILATQERTELGVDAYTLTQYLIPTLARHSRSQGTLSI